MKNRLQFIHHNEVFPTRQEAINYVKAMQIDGRPALFAEPIVLKYESGDAEKGPNVILAIGSHGIGEYDNEGYKRTDQRTFFIDVTEEQENIEDLYNRLAAAIRALTVVPLESDTIKAYANKTDEGTFVSGDVKTAESRIISGIERPNTVQVVSGEGLYHYVDVTYTNDGVLKFQVNDTVKDYTIPTVVSGVYVYEGVDAESIILTMNDGSTVKIPVGKLVNEWTVLPADATNTPIVLKREEVSSEPCPHGVETWQDVLTADIRLKEGEKNIIVKSDSGRTLYATVDLEYDEATNVLTFTTTTGSNEIRLNSVKLIEYIRYDAENEEIVIGYKTSELITDETFEVRIPVSGLITEWEVVPEGHNVVLVRERSVSGTDIVYADVRIASSDIGPNNLIQTIGDNHSLYVRGEADNIKFGNSNVDTELKRLDNEKIRVEGKVDAETTRATSAETVINDTIGTGFTTDSHDNVTYKFNQLTQNLNTTITNLNNEISARTNGDSALTAAITAEVARATSAENTVSSAITAEAVRAQAREGDIAQSVLAETTRATSAETTINNTIGNGLFTTDSRDTVTAYVTKIMTDTGTVSTNLANEVTRATNAESGITALVREEATTRQSETSALSASLTSEVNRAMGVENVLSDKIGTGFSNNELANVTAKFRSVSGRVDTLEDTVNTNCEDIATLNESVEALSGATDGKVQSVTAKDNSIVVDNSNAVNPKVGVNLRVDATNIIKNDNGLYAKVDLTYNDTTNQLTFTTSNGEKIINLVSVSVIKSITYDSQTESLIIIYTVNGRDVTITVPVGDLIDEWEPYNEGHSVTLVKDRIQGNDKDQLSADVKISADADNILEVSNGGYLKVSNTGITAASAAITAETTRATGVENDLSNKIGSGFTSVNNITKKVGEIDVKIDSVSGAIASEILRATGAEQELNASGIAETNAREQADTYLSNQIGTGFTDNSHENVTAKFNQLNTSLNQNIADLTNEVSRATGVEGELRTQLTSEINNRTVADNEIKTNITALSGVTDALNTKFDDKIGSGFTTNPYENVTRRFQDLSGNVASIADDVTGHTVAIGSISGDLETVAGVLQGKIDSIKAKDTTVVVDSSNANNPEIGVKIKDVPSNIIRNDNGVYATVDLDYDELGNKLTFTTSNGSKEISLLSVSIIDRIWYDSTSEELVIEYKVNGHTEVIRVSVHDLINEWEPNNEGHSVIVRKERSVSGTDEVSAEVRLHESHEGFVNLIKRSSEDGSIYVSKNDVIVKLHEDNNAIYKIDDEIGLKIANVVSEINSDGNVKVKITESSGVKELKLDVDVYECGDY